MKLDRAKELAAEIAEATANLNATISKASTEGMVIEVNTMPHLAIGAGDAELITVEAKVRPGDIETD